MFDDLQRAERMMCVLILLGAFCLGSAATLAIVWIVHHLSLGWQW